MKQIKRKALVDVHITNNAVQKTAPNYDPDKGYKWSMGRVRQYLTAKHGQDAVSFEKNS